MVTILYGLDPNSDSVYSQHAQRSPRLVAGVHDALSQGLNETAAHLASRYLVGGSTGVRRGGKAPLASRSGALVGSIDARMTGTWEGEVGAIRGAKRYAKVLLTAGTTVITPKSAKNLWIPAGDNAYPKRKNPMSPREAMSKRGPSGKRLLSIFMSKAGNLVAFLRDPKGGRFSRGKSKGRLRGKLLFVLKKRVEIQGSDALALAVEDKRPRVRSLIQTAANNAIGGGA